ncbi:MAG: phage major capsid protein [Methanosarcinales archaeon]
MKGLEKLATVTTSTISAILPKVIARQIEEAARKVCVARQLFRVNRDLVGKPGRSLVIPKRGSLSASDLSEGAAIATSQGITWSGATVTPTKFGLGFQITQEALDADERDTIRNQLDEAGYAMAEREDTRLMDVILDRTSTTESSATFASKTLTLQLSHKPVLAVTSFKSSGDKLSSIKVDYEDGKIYLSTATAGDTATVEYVYTSLATQYDYVATPTSLKFSDVLSSVAQMKADKENPTHIVLSPTAEKCLISDITTTIKTIQQPAGAEVSMPGAIGKLAGMVVLVTTEVEDGNAVLVDTRRAGWVVDKKDITVKRDENIKRDAIEFTVVKISGAILSDRKAVRIIGGAQSNATAL